jgi:hypothetical protein
MMWYKRPGGGWAKLIQNEPSSSFVALTLTVCPWHGLFLSFSRPAFTTHYGSPTPLATLHEHK